MKRDIKVISIMDDAIANVQRDLAYKQWQMKDRLRIFRNHAAESTAKGIDAMQPDISAVQFAAAKVREDEVLLSNLQTIRAKMANAVHEPEESLCVEANRLAQEIDDLVYEYDTYGYNDAFITRDEGFSAYLNGVYDTDDLALLEELQEMLGAEEESVANKARDLLCRAMDIKIRLMEAVG